MTIPRILSYELPLLDSLPKSRAAWDFDPTRAALLVHDVQEYFLDFYDRTASPIAPMLSNLKRLVELARVRGLPVIYTAQPPEQPTEERGLLNAVWGPGITQSPSRSGIAAELAPGPKDHVLTKFRYSAFQRTDLAGLLSRLGRDQLVVTGVYAHIGCLLSTADAFMRDIETFFVADALADFSRAHHEQAIFQVASCTGRVVGSGELEATLREPKANLTEPRSAPGLSTNYSDFAQELAALLELDPNDLEPNSNLLDWGLDSLRIMTLVERYRALGLEVSFVDLAEEPTPARFWSLRQMAS